MAALNALPPAVKALLRNPRFVALFGLFGAVQLPQLFLQPSRPLVAAAVSLGTTGLFMFVVPFFQGGVLGMAEEALRGRAGLETFVSSGKSNYVSLLLGYLAVFAINFVFGIAAVFAAIFGGVGLYASGGEFGLVALGVVALVALVFVLAYLLFVFTVQFYAHAIVLSDADLVAGFKRSVGLVRRNVLSVLGYSVILLVGGLILGGIGSVASLLLSPQPEPIAAAIPEPSAPMLAGAAIVYVLALALLGSFYAVYSVSFYRSIEERRPTL
jgi:hypothetical protein